MSENIKMYNGLLEMGAKTLPDKNNQHKIQYQEQEAREPTQPAGWHSPFSQDFRRDLERPV